MRLFVFALFLALCFGFISAQTVEVDSFYSASLERGITYKVILPAGYDENESYPVCYLLHGMGASADEWINNTNITGYAKEYKYIFVIPSSGNHWYVNSYTDPKDRYEDYIVKDLPARASSKYPIDTTRQALIGYSMGGYGSLVLGLRYPEKYKFLGPMSSSMDVPGQTNRRLEEFKRGGLIESLNIAFGPDSSTYRNERDPFKLIGKTDAAKLPYIYLATGIDESFTQRIDFHREFTDSLRAMKIKYEYHETPGDHDYEYWNRELLNILRRWEEFLKRQPSFQ